MALLTRILLDQGVIDHAGIEEAIKAQVLHGGRIGTNLYELGLVTEKQLCAALEKCYGFPSVILAPEAVDREAMQSIPEKYVLRHKAVPFARRGRALSIAMVDPGRKSALADISYSTGWILKPHVLPEHRMDRLLEQLFQVPIPWRYTESWDEEVAPEDVQAELRKPIEKLDAAAGRARLEAAVRGRDIPNAVLGYARNLFTRAALFVVGNEVSHALAGFAPDQPADFVEGFSIPRTAASVINDVLTRGSPHRGPLGTPWSTPREADQGLIERLGGGVPRSAFVAPIVLRGRTVNILYGDAGPGRSIPGDLSELMVYLGQVPGAYERLVRNRLQASLKEV